MKERSFDEMVAYINRRVSEMDIAQDYKMELLCMVTELGYRHEKTAQHWIPCSERLPDVDDDGYTDKVLVSFDKYCGVEICEYRIINGVGKWYAGDTDDAPEDLGLRITAWMPLPEPYAERRTDD